MIPAIVVTVCKNNALERSTSEDIDGDSYLCNGPRDDEWSVLWIGQDTLGGIVETEEGSTIDDDTLDWYAETAVQSSQTVGFEDFH